VYLLEFYKALFVHQPLRFSKDAGQVGATSSKLHQ
jgi:hypothetical protein